MNRQPLITLLTDFGTSDAYVGTMKGVMHSICPTAQFIDLTHEVRPQDIRGAAFTLLTSYRYFPSNAVFLVVIDPGVGTDRHPIAVETDHGIYVAPDNGVLSYVLSNVNLRTQITLDNPQYQLPNPSATFHGRDIFSPAAAHLARGVPLNELGKICHAVQRLPDPHTKIQNDVIEGEVLHIDHFGNIITSIGNLTWDNSDTLTLQPQFGSYPDSVFRIHATGAQTTIADKKITTIRNTYAAINPGAPTLLVSSSGYLEIGVNRGNAAEQLGVHLGDPVHLTCFAERVKGELG